MLTVTPIEAFTDNYIWCIQKDQQPGVYVVDPGDGDAVLKALSARGLELAGVLITHHHFDHVGGLDALLAHRQVQVLGPHNPAITQITQRLGAGDYAEVLGCRFQILHVPGHTLDHIAYFHDGDSPLLFCGDTLFAGGCGRIFEGNPAMMYASLQSLAALPAKTQVFCAHEYTLSNLDFAYAVEPDNEALKARIRLDQQARAQGIPTVPSTLDTELQTNPFLRCDSPAVCQQMQQHDQIDPSDPIAVFAAVRSWKDNF